MTEPTEDQIKYLHEIAEERRKSWKDRMEIRHRCFMDGIDWQHHLEGDAGGTLLFPSENSLRQVKTCLEKGGCGVVEVEVRLIRWVEPQHLRYESAPPSGTARE